MYKSRQSHMELWEMLYLIIGGRSKCMLLRTCRRTFCGHGRMPDVFPPRFLGMQATVNVERFSVYWALIVHQRGSLSEHIYVMRLNQVSILSSSWRCMRLTCYSRLLDVDVSRTGSK